MVRAGEQPRAEQHDRGQNPDQLAEQEVDREAQPPTDDQEQADRALQRGDEQDRHTGRHPPEEQDVRRGRREALGWADSGKVLEDPECEEDSPDADS